MAKTLEDTPLIKQFFSVKAQYPEAMLLYRVGDFYETYSDDAVTASKVLGLVLTRKTNGEKGPVAMAGFPHHALEQYLTKLVRAGFKVAVCDQLEDPRFAKKLVKRGVTELVTPGVALGENMLSQKENNYLCALTFEKDRCGAAFLDVSTGEFRVAEGSLPYIGTLLSSMSPKEVLVQRGCEKGVREKFGDFYMTSLDDWAFVYDSAVRKICRQMDTDSLKGFGIEEFPLGVCSAGALVVYLEQTHHEGLRNICSISRIDGGNYVWMDKFTLRNLEVLSSASPDGVSLVQTMDRCCCPMGARLLRHYLAMPVVDLKEIEARHDVVEFFTRDDQALEKVRSSLSEVGDTERILARAAAGKIAPRELLQLSRGIAQTAPVKQACEGKGCRALDEMLGQITDCQDLLLEINTVLCPDPAAQIGKGKVIADGVSDELDNLRSISSGGKDYLLRMQQREAERTGIPSLKIAFNNVFGYYIEVRNTFKDKVPPEWIRKQTLVNAERYITEELKDYEEKIVTAEDRIYILETEIYASLVESVRKKTTVLQANSRTIARLDVLCSFADVALTNHYCRPVLDESAVLDIKGGRHPVIETLMKEGEKYVPNDIFLDGNGKRIMILTGPNMAGKSALLRQTALIVLLAQAGSFVPADSARLGYSDKIFTRVGASDNISRGESTFMVEMLETSMILHNLSERSLVLLDEIGRGTSTYDGMSIARAIVEYIHEKGKGVKTLFATHYHELNDLEALYPGVKDYHIAVKESGHEVIFLRKLAEGGTAHSFGIHVARMAGMPKAVLESAERTLRRLEGSKEKEPVRPHMTPQGKVEADGSIQLSMFQLDDPTLESLRDRLKQADLDNMTPLQAFDLLRSMKEELGLKGR